MEESLKGVVAIHPTIRLIPNLKVVYDPEHDRKKVSLSELLKLCCLLGRWMTFTPQSLEAEGL